MRHDILKMRPVWKTEREKHPTGIGQEQSNEQKYRHSLLSASLSSSTFQEIQPTKNRLDK